MANGRHYAIVIGLTDYPFLGAPPPNLRGPQNDARAVEAWLKAPAGGDLPPDNVQVIVSSNDGRPTRDDIEGAFLKLNAIAAANQQKGEGRRVGDRLYVYVSGHGFSPTRNKGCLFATNASTDAPGANVFASAWLELFQEAGYFREFVLWMDCCMNRLPSAQPSVPIMSPLIVLDPPGPTFIAFAAQRPLKAVERPIPEDGDKVRGIFTWNLLQGLKGAAANRYGMVTGRSLADWLRNSHRARLDAADLADREVGQEPEVVAEDEALIFARGLKPLTYRIELKLPAGLGALDGTLWRGETPRAEPLAFAANGQAAMDLRPGIYLVEVPAANLRHGFEVTCDADVEITTRGATVIDTPGDIFTLSVQAPEAGAELFVIDQAFALVDRSIGSLSARLPFGLYKVRTRSGRRLVELTLLLDRDTALSGAEAPDLPPFSSAAPLPASYATHEYHQAAAQVALGRPPDVSIGKGGGELMLMVRTWSGRPETSPPGYQPWRGVKVLDARGRAVADLERDGVRDGQGDPWATCRLSLPPGAWFLKQPCAGGAALEQALIVTEGWRTDAYLLVRPAHDGEEPPPRLTVLMHQMGEAWQNKSDLLTDQGRVALADGRSVLADELETLLGDKFLNPIAGILGGHLLLVEQAKRPSERLAHLNVIVTNLRNLLGTEHPDVEALSLACPDPSLRTTRPLAAPPMYEASWRLYVEASRARAGLVPSRIWTRVHAQTHLPPYFVWSADEATKARHLEELRDILTRSEPVAAAAAEAAASVPEPAGSAATPRTDPETRARALLLGLPASALRSL